MYLIVKYVHIACAALSVSGFALRGFWMLTSPERLDHMLVRIAPHVVDTVFLLSGITLVVLLRLPVLATPWLWAKLALLVVYVWLGRIALRSGQTRASRSVACVLALATFAWIVGIALNKSVLSWLAA